MAEVALAAEVRSAQGSSNSRRLRAAGKIPGVLYGHGIEPTALAVEARELRLALSTDAGINALIQLDLDGTTHLALARSLQRHPVRGTVSHVDFQVVNRNEQITAEVPLNFIGEADKVTKMGGLVEHVVTVLSVTASAAHLPAHIDVDISELELEGSIRVKDIKLPAGATTSADPEEAVVVGATTRAAMSTGEAGASEAGAEASSEG